MVNEVERIARLEADVQHVLERLTSVERKVDKLLLQMTRVNGSKPWGLEALKYVIAALVGALTALAGVKLGG